MTKSGHKYRLFKSQYCEGEEEEEEKSGTTVE
jgi:hypothetical protein